MHKNRWLWLTLALILVLAIAIPCTADTSNTEKIAKRTEPGVVLVQATFEGIVEIPEPYFDEVQLEYLSVDLMSAIEAGYLPEDESAIWMALADELASAPLSFMKPSGNVQEVESGYRALGTGFIITEDGYVVTNAHVVAPDDEMLKQQMANEKIDEIMNYFMEEIMYSLGDVPPDVRDYVYDSFMTMVYVYFDEHVKVKELKKSYAAGLGVQVPGEPLSQKGLQAELVTAGGAVPKKDVAILKLSGQSNLPTIPLGDSSSLQTGSQIYVMGYPGVATFHPLLSESSQAQPTLTNGMVSAKKTMEGGWDIFQTNADMTHGNSGGPVLNEQGKVIGIATFGSVDFNTGQEIAGMNFVVPSSIVKEFLDRANVTPKESLVTTTYNEGLEFYYQQYYKKALKKFEEVSKMSPGHPLAQSLIADCTKAISEGKDKSTPIWLYGAVGGGVLVIAIVAVFFVRRGKSKKELVVQSEDDNKNS